MALLSAGESELAVLSGDPAQTSPNSNGDSDGGDHSASDTLTEKRVISYAMFRPDEKADGKASGKAGGKASSKSGGSNGTNAGASNGSAVDAPASIEDLLSTGLYLKLFNAAYKEELGSQTVDERDLPPGDSIKGRLEQYVLEKGLQLSRAGIYDPYVVASYLAANPIPASKIDAGTLNRFEQLFEAVNDLYSTPQTR
jgi:hypothetical protein